MVATPQHTHHHISPVEFQPPVGLGVIKQPFNGEREGRREREGGSRTDPVIGASILVVSEYLSAHSHALPRGLE